MKSTLILAAVLALPVQAGDTFTGTQTFKSGTASTTTTKNLNFHYETSDVIAIISQDGKTTTWNKDESKVKKYIESDVSDTFARALWRLEQENRRLKSECAK